MENIFSYEQVRQFRHYLWDDILAKPTFHMPIDNCVASLANHFQINTPNVLRAFVKAYVVEFDLLLDKVEHSSGGFAYHRKW
jgi:hypothetical protein